MHSQEDSGEVASPPVAQVVPIDAASSKHGRDRGQSPDAGGEGKARREKWIDWGKYNQLLQNFALIYGTDTVWDGGERMIMKIANMAHAHGSDVVKLWKASDARRTIRQDQVVFDPTGGCDPDQTVNLFDGIALQPLEGDVAPILELVRFLTSRASSDPDECDEVMHWLLQWMAYPLQHLGTKLRTAVVMHGDEGAGKNFLFDLWVEIYGKYGAVVGQDELEDRFNDWRSAKLAVVGDEVSSRQELVHNKNRLKALITSPTVQINPKNLPRREERNHINIVFLSNELQPLALDNSDRRYLVVFTPRAREFEFYRRLKEWRRAGGARAFYHYLLRYPLDGFDPFAPAPMTQAKQNLIDMNLKSAERFWLEWASGELEPALPYWTCSFTQAYRAYTKYAQRVGDRYPVQKNSFTPMVIRISESRAPSLGLQAVRELKTNAAGDRGQRRTVRMLLVAGDAPDTGRERWAAECVAKFEEPLAAYLVPRPRDGEIPGAEA
jgi:putative DNA primase/helicase